MSSNNISTVQLAAHLDTRNYSQTYVPAANPPALSQSGAGGASMDRDQVSLDSGSSRQSFETLQRLGGITETLNETASRIRETREGLNSSAHIVSRMEGELSRIVKNYPPFSVEDEERVKILMEYSSLRKQIEKLTVPPPPPPLYEKVEGMWKELCSQQDGKVTTPSLERDSSDSAVQAAASQLSTTGGTMCRLVTAIETSL